MFFTDARDAAVCADRLAQSHDVYVGVGLRGRDHGRHERGGSVDIIGIVGFVGDIDVADPVHKQANLPPTFEAAREIVAAMPIQPTILIHSGHGLQAWWLFQEPYLFDDAVDRARVQRISEGWTAQLRAVSKGYAVDSVFDLARVMRIPGTFNRKAEPVQCTVLSADGPLTAGPSDFEAFTADTTPRNGTHEPRTVDGLVFSADAEPPFTRFTSTMDIDTKFRQWWDRKRRDIPDQTSSGYDMALAALGVAYGWDDQEIVNASIAWRRKHGEEITKALRPEYWARTLGKARSGRTVTEILMDERINEASGSEQGQRLTFLSEELGLTARGRVITRAVRRGGEHEESWYYLALDDGQHIDLGQGRELVKLQAMRGRLLDSGAVIKAMKPERWIALLRVLTEVADVEIVREAETTTQLAEWIEAYVANRVADSDDRFFAYVAANKPFRRGVTTYIHAPSLRGWVALERGVNLRPAQLHVWLRGAGFAAGKITVNTARGPGTSRTYWSGDYLRNEPGI